MRTASPERSTMKSYEIVKAAIYNNTPVRLPVFYDCFGCSDRGYLPLQRASSFTPSVEGEDEWGCVWDHTDVKNMGQVKAHPFENGIPEDLAATKHPDYNDESRYGACEEALARLQEEGKYITAGIFMVLFERMHSLCGFENAFCALMDEDERPGMERLAAHIADVHINLVENVSRRFGSAVHGISMTDDFGTQTASYVSAGFWMDFFYPHYKRLFDAMHSAGYDVWVHSCGKVNEIVECYIEAGANVVNLQQPRALGIEEMGGRYQGRIAFESLCDIQHTLPAGDYAQIDDDVEKLMTHWASPRGGFLFSDYGDGEAIGVDKRIKQYMYKRFSEWSERVYGNPLPEPVLIA